MAPRHKQSASAAAHPTDAECQVCVLHPWYDLVRHAPGFMCSMSRHKGATSVDVLSTWSLVAQRYQPPKSGCRGQFGANHLRRALESVGQARMQVTCTLQRNQQDCNSRCHGDLQNVHNIIGEPSKAALRSCPQPTFKQVCHKGSCRDGQCTTDISLKEDARTMKPWVRCCGFKGAAQTIPTSPLKHPVRRDPPTSSLALFTTMRSVSRMSPKQGKGPPVLELGPSRPRLRLLPRPPKCPPS